MRSLPSNNPPARLWSRACGGFTIFSTTKPASFSINIPRKIPKDPAGYFYKTAADWWQLAQQFDRQLPEIEQRMETDYQDTVRVANALLDATDEKYHVQKSSEREVPRVQQHSGTGHVCFIRTRRAEGL